MPAVFVLIWSTGFIVARYGMPHAPPLKFLAVRYALSVLCFCVWVAAARVAWPRVAGAVGPSGGDRHPDAGRATSGGVWAAVKAGMGVGAGRVAGGHAAGAHRAVAVAARRARSAGGNGRAWCSALPGLVLVVWRKLGMAARSRTLTMSLALLRAVQHHRRHALPEAVRRALRRAHRQRGADAGGPGRHAAARAARSREHRAGTPNRLAPWPGRCWRCRWAAARCCIC